MCRRLPGRLPKLSPDRLVSLALEELSNGGVRRWVPVLIVVGWLVGGGLALRLVLEAGLPDGRAAAVYATAAGMLGLTLWSYRRAAWGCPGFWPRDVWASLSMEELRCAKCEGPKPRRTHHCRRCGHCVLGMCHHCVFTDNCVGALNLKAYLLFVGYCLALAVSGLWVGLCRAFGLTRAFAWVLAGQGPRAAVAATAHSTTDAQPPTAPGLLLGLASWIGWLLGALALAAFVLLCAATCCFLGLLLYRQLWLVSFDSSMVDSDDDWQRIQSGAAPRPSFQEMLGNWLRVFGLPAGRGMGHLLLSREGWLVLLTLGLPTQTNPQLATIVKYGLGTEDFDGRSTTRPRDCYEDESEGEGEVVYYESEEGEAGGVQTVPLQGFFPPSGAPATPGIDKLEKGGPSLDG